MVYKELQGHPHKSTQREIWSGHSRQFQVTCVRQQKGYRLKRKLFPPVELTPISLCFTGFKLVCILLYNSVSVSLSPSFLPPAFLLHTHPFSPHDPLPPSHYLCTPRQSSALSITSHRRNKSEHTNQPPLTLGYSEEQESMVLVLAFQKRKQEPIKPTKTKKTRKERIYFVFFTFWCLSHPFSAKFLSFFWKKKKCGRK